MSSLPSSRKGFWDSLFSDIGFPSWSIFSVIVKQYVCESWILVMNDKIKKKYL
jgi:hypothetical protein